MGAMLYLGEWVRSPQSNSNPALNVFQVSFQAEPSTHGATCSGLNFDGFTMAVFIARRRLQSWFPKARHMPPHSRWTEVPEYACRCQIGHMSDRHDGEQE